MPNWSPLFPLSARAAAPSAAAAAAARSRSRCGAPPWWSAWWPPSSSSSASPSSHSRRSSPPRSTSGPRRVSESRANSFKEEVLRAGRRRGRADAYILSCCGRFLHSILHFSQQMSNMRQHATRALLYIAAYPCYNLQVTV